MWGSFRPLSWYFAAACKHQHQQQIAAKTSAMRHNLKFCSTQKLACWRCGASQKTMGVLFCDRCHSIQRPGDTGNYFKVFELPEHYPVNVTELRQKYRQMQSQLHPDKFSNSSAEEKSISEEFSALVNRAYDALQTPLKRAVHLLALKGQSIKDDEQIDDPGFLMEIMELNEEVENADTPDKLIKLDEKNKAVLDKLEMDIRMDFDNNLIDKAKVDIVKMKYFNSIKSHINNLMRERGITL